MYRYDRETGEILDVEYWWANLAIANSISQDDRPPVWVKEFSAKEGYGLKDMSAASWQALGESFTTNEDMLSLYMNNFYKGVPPRHFSARGEGHVIACYALSGTPQERESCSLSPLTSQVVVEDDIYSDDLNRLVESTIKGFIRFVTERMLRAPPPFVHAESDTMMVL